MRWIWTTLTLSLLLLATAVVSAQEAPEGDRHPDALDIPGGILLKPRDAVPRELTFIGYLFTRSTSTNITPTDDVLQGQVIGRLFGRNSTSTVPRTALYTEQRFVPFLVYRPKVLDGYAVLRTMFKLDMTWGDQAYGVGGNRGGAINGAQVNLQTLMANATLSPPGASWKAVVGLQRLFDNVRDPNVNTLQTAQTSGYKMAYWGTNAVGVNLFAEPIPGTLARVGFFQLWENLISKNDDVTLWMADAETRIAPTVELGADLWYVRDRGKGAGGISVLGQGLNSALAEYNGATRLRFPGTGQIYEADLLWLGGHAAKNRDFLAGRLWADAFVMANLGRIDTVGVTTAKAADVFAVTGNASVAYKYGRTAGDRIQLEGLFTTGDGDGARDGTVNSVITGNAYGSPVGIYSSHRALLLFPDPQVVNRYYSAVHDISNMGLGVNAAFLNVSRDLIPNRMNGKLGLATAFSNTTPTGGSKHIGTEMNLELKYNLKVFLTLGLDVGYMRLGGFYDSPSATFDGQRPDHDPWVAFTTLSWLMF
jgi:hypothetical protein